MKTQKLLIIWGMIWLFLWLAAGLSMGPRVESLTQMEKSAHSHALCLSMVVLVMGLLQPFMGLSEKVRYAFGWVLAVGTFLSPVGILLELASSAMFVIPMIGAILVVISILVYLIGILRFVSQEE